MNIYLFKPLRKRNTKLCISRNFLYWFFFLSTDDICKINTKPKFRIEYISRIFNDSSSSTKLADLIQKKNFDSVMDIRKIRVRLRLTLSFLSFPLSFVILRSRDLQRSITLEGTHIHEHNDELRFRVYQHFLKCLRTREQLRQTVSNTRIHLYFICHDTLV